MRYSALLAVVLVAVLGFAVYLTSVDGEFIWDDQYLIKENVYVKNPADLSKLFTKDIGAGTGLNSASYRPLQMLSYMANYLLGKFDTRGYHLTNILFHILAALALIWFINTVFNDRVLSLLAGLLFVAHPIHTEAVSYISGRADPMALLFMLLAFIFYIKSIHSKNINLFVLTSLSYILALLSRESVLILPALVLVYHYAFKKKIHRNFLFILAVSLLYILLRVFVIRTDFPGDTVTTTLFERLPGFFVAVTNYLRLLLWPVGLHMEYGDRIFNAADLRALSGFFISLFLLI